MTVLADLENVFGRDNISSWADLDNDANPTTIANRIAWAIELATAEVEALTTGTSYDWAEISSNVLINNAIATKAGLLLYANRAHSDEGADGSTPKNPMRTFEKRMDLFFKQLTTGALKLQSSREGRSFPAVVEDDYGDVSTERIDGVNSGRVYPWGWIVG